LRTPLARRLNGKASQTQEIPKPVGRSFNMSAKSARRVNPTVEIVQKGTCDFADGSDFAEKFKVADCNADLSGR
jgi:hypothetical protein